MGKKRRPPNDNYFVPSSSNQSWHRKDHCWLGLMIMFEESLINYALLPLQCQYPQCFLGQLKELKKNVILLNCGITRCYVFLNNLISKKKKVKVQ